MFQPNVGITTTENEDDGYYFLVKKEAIILDMCYTYDHSFGLEYDPKFPLNSGYTDEQREALERQMRQIFDNCIAPHMELKKIND